MRRKDVYPITRREFLLSTFSVVLMGLLTACQRESGIEEKDPEPTPTGVLTREAIKLPEPVQQGKTAVERALFERRSIRDYSGDSLTLPEISQLLWAAQGITHPNGYRTAPSAGALYPLEVYLLVGNVDDLPQGVYWYQPHGHELLRVLRGENRQALYEVALKQEAVRDAAAVIVLSAVYERTTQKYSQRGFRYVHMEIGCASQNVYLQALSLGLATVFIGAFYDDEVRNVLGMVEEEVPLGLMPVGRL